MLGHRLSLGFWLSSRQSYIYNFNSIESKEFLKHINSFLKVSNNSICAMLIQTNLQLQCTLWMLSREVTSSWELIILLSEKLHLFLNLTPYECIMYKTLMLTHLEEILAKKSQSQSFLFLGGLVFLFNCGISIHDGSLDHHSQYIIHETLKFCYDKLQDKRNT